MVQPPDPLPPSEPTRKKPRPYSYWGQQTEVFLEKISEPIDRIGHLLMGDLWKTFYETVQDAIALSLLLHIPSWLGRITLGKSFSSFDACLQENAFGVGRYACFIIVSLDFLLWIVLGGRVLGRFWVDLGRLRGSKKANKQDSRKS